MEEKYGSAELRRDYNRACGIILREERQKRNISLESLASGLLSGAALGKMESGKAGWRMLTGAVLLQRMGLISEDFETVASSEELERWRKREDICLLIPDRPREAERGIQEYRRDCPKREPAEEQFLLRAELTLRLMEKGGVQGIGDGEELLLLAGKAVSCTVSGDWKKDMECLLLAPSELETILLAGAAEMVCGRKSEARRMQQAVRDYPESHQWEERAAVRILPQAALLGMALAMEEGDDRRAYEQGREALELLRGSFSHCYLLPLLKMLGNIPRQGLDEEEREYLELAETFRKTFERIYGQHHYPGDRIWQGLSVENIGEAGVILKMLRKFAGKPRAKAVYDGEEQVVTERQLEKIESGVHKPSFENYQRLIRQYGKQTGWATAMLETDSAQVLELRQEIASLVALCQWDKVKWELEKLRRMVDPAYPRVKQELLFLEAILMEKETKDLGKSLEMLQAALKITAPNLEAGDKKWWVYQREEAIIVGNIADSYRKLGNPKQTREWLEILRFSLEQQKGQTGIERRAYDILMEAVDNYLGDMKQFEQAIKASEEAACNYLKRPEAFLLVMAYYRIAWNAYEMALETPSQRNALEQKWREAFRISEVLTNFLYDDHMMSFLKERRNKYLY